MEPLKCVWDSCTHAHKIDEDLGDHVKSLESFTHGTWIPLWEHDAFNKTLNDKIFQVLFENPLQVSSHPYMCWSLAYTLFVICILSIPCGLFL